MIKKLEIKERQEIIGTVSIKLEFLFFKLFKYFVNSCRREMLRDILNWLEKYEKIVRHFEHFLILTPDG